MNKLLFTILIFTFLSCTKKDNSNTVWIYTSLYKDTISKLKPRLNRKFPGIKFKFYQAGSEEIASKVNAEILTNNLQADVLISSDRFWYEELADNKVLSEIPSEIFNRIPQTLRHPLKMYGTLSLPVMVLCYNDDAISKEQVPSSFLDLSKDSYKNLFTTGSPLASGTNFTTMAMLQHNYGWEYFKKLKGNNTISQGGNSSVLRRIQSKERPIGWVLLENVLRFQKKDQRLKIIYPKDGVVTNNNVLAITKKERHSNHVENFVRFMFSEEGQALMTDSFMYSPFKDFPAPKGAPPLSFILENSFPWSREFITKTTVDRLDLKEEYSTIMFQ
ncbi:MAG: hypothetical protein CME61_02050 [Halobacteriovoraceae bacterium]|nr:hypothetical protein [Halobacteriovoraceae bacterium]